MTVGQVLLVILILLLVGAVPWGGYHSYGYGPPSLIGVLLIVILVLLLLGKI